MEGGGRLLNKLGSMHLSKNRPAHADDNGSQRYDSRIDCPQEEAWHMHRGFGVSWGRLAHSYS